MKTEPPGFKKEYFNELFNLEASNFWFRFRNRLIVWALKKHNRHLDNFLEIGCGTGFVVSEISKNFPDTRVYASEYFEEGLSHARTRTPKVNFMQMDARQIPYNSFFDAIGAFDVLEHIKEDELVLQQISNALRPNGFVYLTVPQHKWLWSHIDDYACHVRRYSHKELKTKLECAGFTPIFSTSFVSFLLPAMYLSRLKKNNPENLKMEEIPGLKTSKIANLALTQILKLEFFILSRIAPLPLGGSRFIVAQKTQIPEQP